MTHAQTDCLRTHMTTRGSSPRPILGCVSRRVSHGRPGLKPWVLQQMETRVPGPGGGSLQFPSAVETEMAVPEVQLPTPSQAVPVMDLRVATPGLNSGELDGFTLDTWTLVDSVVQTAINRRQPTGTPAGNSHQVILHGVEETRRDNRGEFEDMCSHLLLSSANIYLSVQQIFEGMFNDHTINWGRINVLLAFGGHLAQHCLMNGMGEVVESLTPWMTAFICTRLREWILEHGGWVGSTC